MNVTIKTKAKTIEIEEGIKLEDLYKGLQELLGESWKEYRLIQKINHINNPIPYPIQPAYPDYPIITYGTAKPNIDHFTTTCKTDSPFTETK